MRNDKTRPRILNARWSRSHRRRASVSSSAEDGDEGRPLHPLDEKLGDPVAGGDREGLGAVVREDDPHLAPVVAVDDPGEGVDAVAHGQSAAGPHEPDVPGGDLDPEPGRDRGPASGRDLEPPRWPAGRPRPPRPRSTRARARPRRPTTGTRHVGERSSSCSLIARGWYTAAPGDGYDRRMSRPNLFGMGRDALAAARRRSSACRLSGPARSSAGSTSGGSGTIERDVRPPEGPPRRPRRAVQPAVARGHRAHPVLRRDAEVPLRSRRRRHDRVGLHPRGRPPDDLHLDPGRLPPEVRLLPDRASPGTSAT